MRICGLNLTGETLRLPRYIDFRTRIDLNTMSSPDGLFGCSRRFREYNLNITVLGEHSWMSFICPICLHGARLKTPDEIEQRYLPLAPGLEAFENVRMHSGFRAPPSSPEERTALGVGDLDMASILAYFVPFAAPRGFLPPFHRARAAPRPVSPIVASPPLVMPACITGFDRIPFSGTDTQCVICYDNETHGNLGIRLNCSHVFHKNCIQNWVQTQYENFTQWERTRTTHRPPWPSECPSCRSKII